MAKVQCSYRLSLELDLQYYSHNLSGYSCESYSTLCVLYSYIVLAKLCFGEKIIIHLLSEVARQNSEESSVQCEFARLKHSENNDYETRAGTGARVRQPKAAIG